MSNETKRDVLKLALRYVPVGEEYDAIQDSSAGDLYDTLLEKYDAALPDDLPVIPKATGKLIKAMKANSDSLFASESTLLVMDRLGLIPFDALKITKWINEHQNTFARAWLLDIWRVEETGEIVKLEAEK